MAKNKRKISASQRDKLNIERAKILKKAGIISKRANLHSGAYISRGVLKKVRAYENLANLNYKAYTAPKSVVKAAQERGYQTIGGTKIVGPKTAQFRKRIATGVVAGLKPVKGGYMEEVILPHTVFDIRSLTEQLEQGIDSLKLQNEYFAIKYKGNESYRAFPTTRLLLEHLRHYNGFQLAATMKPEELQEEFDALTIFRLHRNDETRLLRNVRQRKEDRKRERMEAIARGEYVGTPVRRKTISRAEKAERMHPAMAKTYLARMARSDAKKRAKIEADPVKLQAYREAAKKRAKASRERKKGK